jgi:hypothetical protein
MMFDLNDGFELPTEVEGLPLLAVSAFRNDSLAILYGKAGEGRILLAEQGSKLRQLPSFPLHSTWVKFTMTSDGGWVVGHRHKTSDPATDCQSYGSNGTKRLHFDGGGAIGFMQTTEKGAIWIGHEDDDPSSEAKMGGLSLLSAQGEEKIYSWFRGFEGDAEFGMAFWCCYALNVIGETAWTQFYVPMYLSRTEPDCTQEHWLCLPHGAAALAIQNDLVAFIGRYDERQFEIAAYKLLAPPDSESLGLFSFTIRGKRPKFIDHVDGRGDTIHIVHDNIWYRYSMAQILAFIAPQ